MKNLVLKNIFQLASGTLISQLILFGATPILTRLYSPEDFGLLTIFNSISALLAGCLTLKLDAAIPLPRVEREAITLSRVTLQLSLFFSVTILILEIILIKNSIIDGVFILIPFSTFFSAYITVQQQWFTRQRNYNIYATAQIITSISNTVTAVLAGVLFHNYSALIICLIIGLASSSLFLFLHTQVKIFFFKLRSGDFYYILRKYLRFPQYVLPTTIILTGSQYFQPLLISKLASVELTGFYSIANRVVMVPVIILGGAISESLKSEFISNLNESSDKLRRTFRKILLVIFVLASVAILAIYLLSDTMFPIFFGEIYISSAEIAKAISVGVFSIFIYQSFYFIFTLLDKNRIGLLIQGGITFVPLIGLAAMDLYGGLIAGLYLWSALTLLFCFLGIAVINRSISHRCSVRE